MKRILFCVTGLTPQIVTETLYALAHRPDPWIPDEIHLLTTVRGAEHARLTLFIEEGGWFHRLVREYNLPAMYFNDKHIHLVCNRQGEPLEDIRTEADNRALADAITYHIRHFCSRADTALHVSLAGGRKTMGFFAGYILSLFGREQDRLSHVLVGPEPFENHPQFFYPTPYSSPIRDRSGRIMDRSQANVVLADVPFLRLQPLLDQDILQGTDSFEQLIARLQADLRPDTVRLDMRCLKLFIGGQPIKGIGRINFLFYSWILWRHKQQQPSIPFPSSEDIAGDFDLAAAFIEWIRCFGEPQGDFERSIVSLQRNGLSHSFVRDRKTRINKALKRALGLNARHYQLAIHRPSHTLFVGLSPEYIDFDNIVNPLHG
ncbi:MAG TPA: TIGR02584 family CRISPR-associated protein [Sulfurivirga caldicuralii]|nr:TIGR02584 family CRISPR-associated protein [Sulfurivirga caldicuralii]